ncbi:hypothetical protein [Macrococcus capreoli]|uniref:hypothetical protein n=1 Tax=Macrococcus capreoli TaxID=2982690 RepID=UPI003EE46CF6
MYGIILNEAGFRTYPFEVLKYLEPYVKSLKWKINAHEHNGDFLYDDFPFNPSGNQLMDGDAFYNTLASYSDVQWIWGVLSGFPNEISWEEIERDAVEYDITEDSIIWNGGLSHVESKAVFEIVAMDSSTTIVLADDESVINELLEYFPRGEELCIT